MSEDDVSPTMPAPAPADIYQTRLATARALLEAPRRGQFSPGQRIKDSNGRPYWVDPGGSLRRADGGKLTKAGRKAAKQRRRLELRRGTWGR
jgi:hypothetical protein